MIETAQMTAADIMQTPVHCASPDDRLADLEKSLFDRDVGGMPVVDDGRLVGIVSRSEFIRVPQLLEDWTAYARDELTRDGAAWVDPDTSPETPNGGAVKELGEQIRVRHVMPSHVVTCSPDTAVPAVATLMTTHHVHRVIVVEEDSPVGIISSLDLVRLLADVPDA